MLFHLGEEDGLKNGIDFTIYIILYQVEIMHVNQAK